MASDYFGTLSEKDNEKLEKELEREAEARAEKDRRDERAIARFEENLSKRGGEPDKNKVLTDRAKEKKRFLQTDLSIQDMFRQSCARAYFIKSRRDMYLPIGSPEWSEIPKAAFKLQSRFQVALEKVGFAEAKLQVALNMGDKKIIKECREEADDLLKVCLHAHYGIGRMYTDMVDRGVGNG